MFLGIILVTVQFSLAQSEPSPRGPRGGGKDYLLFRLERLGKELNLTPDQQAKLDTLKRDMQSMAEQQVEKRRDARKTVESELSKTNPNLDQISSMMHAQIDENARFRHTMLSRIGEFCSDLSPEQKKIVYDGILGRTGDRAEE